MNSNKKITLVISSLAGGGAEGVCVSIANSFSEKGWNVDLIILNLNNQVNYEKLANNVNLILLNVKYARYSPISLLRYIFTYKPKLFFIFNYELSVILLILRFLFRFKFKIISRNINTMSIKIKKLKEKRFWSKYVVYNLISYFYKKNDYIVNQCYAMQRDLLKIYPELTNSTRVIYNPIPSHFENYANKEDLNKIKKKDYILCVGRLEKQKAFHYAIEAFAGITNQFPNLRLKIVGQGILLKQLKKVAESFNISAKVDFEGYQKNIIPYYLKAKVTILTSHYEGYPNVLIESIAMNTPVIAFDCMSGPNEIIQDGINGYLVKHLDTIDLKDKLSNFLANKTIMKKNLKNSLRRNEIKSIINNYEKLFNSFI